MKAFFEEYGLVLIVTIIATGMIAFAGTFRNTMQDTITEQWDNMTGIYETCLLYTSPSPRDA